MMHLVYDEVGKQRLFHSSLKIIRKVVIFGVVTLLLKHLICLFFSDCYVNERYML